MTVEQKKECCDATKSCDTEKEQMTKNEKECCDAEKKPEATGACSTDKGSCDTK